MLWYVSDFVHETFILQVNSSKTLFIQSLQGNSDINFCQSTILREIKFVTWDDWTFQNAPKRSQLLVSFSSPPVLYRDISSNCFGFFLVMSILRGFWQKFFKRVSFGGKLFGLISWIQKPPGARYYGGNEFIDQAERLCQQRALEACRLDPKDRAIQRSVIARQRENNFLQMVGVLDIPWNLLRISYEIIWSAEPPSSANKNWTLTILPSSIHDFIIFCPTTSLIRMYGVCPCHASP